MKIAVIFSIPSTTDAGCWWRWRSADGSIDSTPQFADYYDCVADARTHGYECSPLLPPARPAARH